MTAPWQRDRERSGARLEGPRRIRAHERARLVAFLDDGLRGGERGRLEAEYPLSMNARDLRGHYAIFAERRPVAHAMLHGVEIRARACGVRVGLIGNVYTAPEWRGRGFARRCVEACVAAARVRGFPVVMLWSERHELYAQLGFSPCGHERRISLGRSAIAQARVGDAAQDVGAVRSSDFPALESLYASKPVHVFRAPGSLSRLARAPEVALLVARSGRGEAIAYAACGRGDDLRGVIHEWAGDASGVLACIDALHEQCAARLLLASAEAEPAAERLIAAGAASTPTPLALARVLDEQALARAIGTTDFAAWPLYVWGFDSI
jgi:GNAT superfamily N-acetyltransferase